MNTFILASPFAPESTQPRHDSDASPYATAAQTAAVLRSGAQYRRERLDAADMITTDEAATLAGTTRVTPPSGPRCSLWPSNWAHPMAGSCWRFWSPPLRRWTAKRRAPRWSRARRWTASWHWQRLRHIDLIP